MPTVQYFVDEIKDLYAIISTTKSLKPSPHTNAILRRLVNLCLQPQSPSFSAAVLSDPAVSKLINDLRPLCAVAETFLEEHWAAKILDAPIPRPYTPSEPPTGSQDTPSFTPIDTHAPVHPPSDPRALLQTFIYYQNYLDLSRLECNTLESFLPLPDGDITPRLKQWSFAFVGSGPLPLSSFCILDRYPEACVHNIDKMPDALETSRQLAEKLGYASRMRWTCVDVSLSGDEGEDEGEGEGEGEVKDESASASAATEMGVDAKESTDSEDKGSELVATASKPDTEIETKTKPDTDTDTELYKQPAIPWPTFDVVILAALVGMFTQTKLNILATLAHKLAPGTLVLVRSARGLRGLIYPVLDFTQDLREIGYEVLVEVHPWTQVVNSAVVLRVLGK